MWNISQLNNKALWSFWGESTTSSVNDPWFQEGNLSQLYRLEQCFCFCFYFDLWNNASLWQQREWASQTSNWESIIDQGPSVCTLKSVSGYACAQGTLPMGCSQPNTGGSRVPKRDPLLVNKDSLDKQLGSWAPWSSCWTFLWMHNISLYDSITDFFLQFIILASQYLQIWNHIWFWF